RREFGSTDSEVGFDDTLSLDGAAAEVVGDIARFTYFDEFSCAAWIRPEEPSGTIISRMTPVEEGDGYSLHMQDGRLQANLVKRWLDDSIRIETRRQLAPDQWHHVVLTYDGSRRADGVSIYVDGEREPCDVRLDALNQSFDNDQPLRIGGGAANFVGQIDDARVYNRCLPADEVRVIACADSIERLVQTAASDRDARQTAKLRAYYIANAAAKDVRAAHERYAQLDHRRAEFVESLPTVMVMQELPKPSEAHVLIRGQYDRPGESVGRGVPACLPPLTEIPVDSVGNGEQSPPDRLMLARWLVDARHPLTARVIVNRYWQMFFGVGLVKTSEDFGVQGEPPSNPELLDWLAVEFMESGWDVKRLHRLIVTSAAYQRDSQTTPELLRVDPENRLLARGPRFRLSAEMIRDQALALAGLLNSQVGGPSVKPYQPEGLWKEIATVTDYNQSHGRDLYRRSLYTYWKRTVASPTMLTFDATARETCTVRRSRTNTPLQALNLLNDVAFVEAAKQMAWRVQRELPAERRDEANERMRTAFRMATARWPTASETDALVRGHDRHVRYFQEHVAEARELLATGESRLPDEAIANERDIVGIAADTMMMNLLLNLDETLTKE
ncbi:MAG: DUF1553 domain-containing protein, partial [Planctomycetales bacterium]|nr:DUF1553 domain-containing protein [Planctomycetales bacterium]